MLFKIQETVYQFEWVVIEYTFVPNTFEYNIILILLSFSHSIKVLLTEINQWKWNQPFKVCARKCKQILL